MGASAYAAEDGKVTLTYGVENAGERPLDGYVVTVRDGERVVAQRAVDDLVVPGAQGMGELTVEDAGVADASGLVVEVAPLAADDGRKAASSDAEVQTDESLAQAGRAGDVSAADVAPIADQAYTGEAVTPRPAVTLDGRELAEGADYRLSYADNVDPGTAIVTITGTGGYVGSKSAAFRVVAKSRWVRQAGAWYYYDADGGMARGWKSVGGKWYYLNPSSGAMRTGWLKSGSTWYYLTSSGAMAVGWCKVGSAWYYFAASGAMKTGWIKLGSAWYYLKGSGAMATGWAKLGSTWYYFNASGAMLTGWQRIGGKWYYFSGSGAMKTGWQKLGSTWYYFNSSGAMLTGRQSIGGKWYTFSSSGAWVA